jgi:hypothetical protein
MVGGTVSGRVSGTVSGTVAGTEAVSGTEESNKLLYELPTTLPPPSGTHTTLLSVSSTLYIYCKRGVGLFKD